MALESAGKVQNSELVEKEWNNVATRDSPLTNERNRDSLFCGHDLTALLLESADGFTIGCGPPVILGSIIIICHLLQDLDCPVVRVFGFPHSVMLAHADEAFLPSLD